MEQSPFAQRLVHGEGGSRNVRFDADYHGRFVQAMATVPRRRHSQPGRFARPPGFSTPLPIHKPTSIHLPTQSQHLPPRRLSQGVRCLRMMPCRQHWLSNFQGDRRPPGQPTPQGQNFSRAPQSRRYHRHARRRCRLKNPRMKSLQARFASKAPFGEYRQTFTGGKAFAQ